MPKLWNLWLFYFALGKNESEAVILLLFARCQDLALVLSHIVEREKERRESLEFP
jgi:hypothetical protein